MNRSAIRIKFGVKDAVGMAVSAVFMYLVFRNINWTLLRQNSQYFWAPPYLLAMAWHTVQTYVLGWRWGYLFNAALFTKKVSGVASYWLGNLYNNLLPGRLGDAVKVYHFSNRYGLPYRTSIAALIAEKIIDVQALGVFAAVYLVFFKLQVPAVNVAATVLVAGIVMADVVLALMVYVPPVRKAVFGWLPAKLGRRWWYSLFWQVVFMFRYLADTKKAVLFFAWALMVVAGGVFTVYLLLLAGGLQQPFVDPSTCLALPLLFLVIHFVPSAPSGVGVVHYGIYKALLLVAAAKGIEITPALESRIVFGTLLFHLVYFIPETLVGFLYLIKERHRLFGGGASG